MAEQERCFENLASYQLALKIYSAACRLESKLPPEERYNLADQLRRAALSVLRYIHEEQIVYHAQPLQISTVEDEEFPDR